MNRKMKNIPSSTYAASLPLSKESKHVCIRENMTEDFAVKFTPQNFEEIEL